jgi:transglycosylase-like protein with SLT domain
MRFASLFLLGAAAMGQTGAPEYFRPAHTLAGIGVSRDDLSDELVETRTKMMIESQTFVILRDPEAVLGAKRVTGDRKLQTLFRQASERSGIPAALLEAMVYLESWGDPKAQSVAGPRGILQLAQATARRIGLRVVQTTRYRTVREKVQSRNAKGKLVTRVVRRKVPYLVRGRDDRMSPERVIPAVAEYLVRLEQKFGGRDWAIWAYHCGEGCVAEMQELTRQARGIPQDRFTVARMFFSCSPVWNRELYQAVQMQMDRDYSPTYWFRIMRAEQLLESYRRDPDAFVAAAEDYKMQFEPGGEPVRRAPHRLSVWLKRADLQYHTSDDIRAGMGSLLVRPLDRPDYFGYRLRIEPDQPGDLEYLSQASPAAVGTLTYIAFETRRLWEEMKSNERFRPLEVTSLVESEEFATKNARAEAWSHESGQVFDIDYSAMPPGEYECLRFVLNDLGWEGYLGFVEDGKDTLHIGCSPSSRDFFTSIYKEAADPLTQQVKRDE